MKLIIDIPKETYDIYKEYAHDIDINTTVGAIANGIPYEERPKGEWIEEPGKIPHCSICGTYSDDADREDGGFYCTHCGADMRGEQDND